MKTRLLLLLLTIFSATTTSAQMRVQQDDNTATFIVDDNTDGDDWDANGNPIYLYLYIDAADTSNGVASEPLGPWPGERMIDLGDNLYKITIDLSDFYPSGTTISEIQFTYNDNMGNQNPAGAGFNATDHSFVPLTTLSVLDFEKNKPTYRIIDGQLTTTQNENVSISIYNVFGQLVKTYANVNLSNHNGFELNLNNHTIYLVKIESEKGIQIIKTIK